MSWKLSLWNYGIGWHIQKEQDEKRSLAKTQPLSANWCGDTCISNIMLWWLLTNPSKNPFRRICMESSEKTRAYISWDTNLHQQADFWQGGFFHSCRNSEYASQSRHTSPLCWWINDYKQIWCWGEVTLQWTSILSWQWGGGGGVQILVASCFGNWEISPSVMGHWALT